jgi:hypothetical protein
MESYGYKQIIINDLSKINKDSYNFYNYKGLNFLSKLKNENKNIVIIFHGSIPESQKGCNDVIFRGYNYNIKNTDIVCISDYLLDKYKDYYLVNWTLSTKKYNYSDNIYKELFNYLINNKIYRNVIFTGTSAGGLPSVKFASYYNSIAIISNSQLYLENYTKRFGIYQLKKMLEENDDELIYEEKQIENIILHSNPKKIIYYQNKNDDKGWHSAYNDFLQFKTFMINSKLNHICEYNLFENNILENKKTEHHVQFPNEKTHLQILQEYLL